MTMTVEPGRRRRKAPAGHPPSYSSAPPSSSPSSSSPAQRLRYDFAAVRVSFTWLGVRKTLNAEQKNQAAQQFGAEGQYLSAAKKLLDTRHPAYAAVTAVRSQIVRYWKAMSLPYPEPGIRLIRQQDVEAFGSRMNELAAELDDAVTHLDAEYEPLRQAARERLGSLYNPQDYPTSLTGLFAVEFDFPSVEPPQYLMRLSPQLFEQERQRIMRRFDEAVALAEEAFTEQFGQLVSHLVERLSGAGPDGQPKVFRDSAVTGLSEFFERFRTLSVRSSPQLEELVETARKTLSGVKPQGVREDQTLRQKIASELSSVQSALDGMLVDRPRRRVLRPAQVAASGGKGAEGEKP